jgi:DNA-binding NarL/FixJ family response regulator
MEEKKMNEMFFVNKRKVTLTPHEIAVVKLVQAGYSYPEIAKKKGTSAMNERIHGHTALVKMRRRGQRVERVKDIILEK